MSASFSGIKEGAIKFNDFDLDGDQDVLLCGNILSGDSTELYLNDGTGSFTLNTSVQLMGLERSDAVFEDLNGDSYPDILISGRNNAGQHKTNLYQNNGLGNFIDLGPSGFAQCHETSFASEDIDNDGDLDIVMVGKPTTSYHTGMYINQGGMTFTLNSSANMEGAAYGFAEIFDMNQDGLKEVLMSGRTSAQSITKCYHNDGTLSFPRISGNNILSLTEGEGEFGDVDNDGDLDLFATGLGQGYISSEIYINDGTGKFTIVPSQPFTNLYASAVELGDIDGDGDLDVVLAGTTGSQQYLWKYKNDGTGDFTFSYQNLPGSQTGDMEMFDCDGDSDLDLLVSGSFSGAKLYLNDGLGVFTISGNSFQFLGNAACDHADIDGDGDQDIINSGVNGIPITNLYTNDGLGNYTLVSGTPFVGVEFGDVKFADIDGDNDMDLLVLGKGLSGPIYTELYKNDGLGNFSSFAGSLTPLDHGSAEFFDADGDLDLDLLISGEQISNNPTAKFYENDGNGNYTELPNLPFSNAELSNIAVGDINNDGDTDVFLMGEEDHHIYYSRIYENTSCVDNTFVTDTICSGDSYTFPDGSFEAQIQSDTLQHSSLTSLMGCDSVVHTYIHAQYSYFLLDTFDLCAGQSYTFPDGSTISSIVSDTLQESSFLAITGCDSSIQTQLFVYPTYSTLNSVQVCEGLNCGFPNGDTLYNATLDSIHTSTFSSIYGCDSVIITDLLVLNNSSSFDTVNACLSYVWIDGNTYTSSTNSATFITPNSAGCDSIITLDLTINTDTTLTVTGGTITSNQVSATSYQWIDCTTGTAISGATSNSYTPTQNGSYAVAIDNGGCTDTSACQVIGGIGFNEVDNSQLEVYPNPTIGQFSINLSISEEIQEILVYSLTGELIYSTNSILSNQTMIDISFANKGMYMLIVTTNSGTYMTRVINE